MLKTYYYKDFTYKGTTYKFKEKLRVRVNEFLLPDFKTYATEIELLGLNDGFSVEGTFKDVEKEIKKYIKYAFDTWVSKPDEELDYYERVYKQQWINMIKPPKEKSATKKVKESISAVAVDVSKKKPIKKEVKTASTTVKEKPSTKKVKEAVKKKTVKDKVEEKKVKPTLAELKAKTDALLNKGKKSSSKTTKKDVEKPIKKATKKLKK